MSVMMDLKSGPMVRGFSEIVRNYLKKWWFRTRIKSGPMVRRFQKL